MIGNFADADLDRHLQRRGCADEDEAVRLADQHTQPFGQPLIQMSTWVSMISCIAVTG